MVGSVWAAILMVGGVWASILMVGGVWVSILVVGGVWVTILMVGGVWVAILMVGGVWAGIVVGGVSVFLKQLFLFFRAEEKSPSVTYVSPSHSVDSGYDSAPSHDDNPVIREVMFDLKNDYEEKDGIGGNGVQKKYVNDRINRRLEM